MRRRRAMTYSSVALVRRGWHGGAKAWAGAQRPGSTWAHRGAGPMVEQHGTAPERFGPAHAQPGRFRRRRAGDGAWYGPVDAPVFPRLPQQLSLGLTDG